MKGWGKHPITSVYAGRLLTYGVMYKSFQGDDGTRKKVYENLLFPVNPTKTSLINQISNRI